MPCADGENAINQDKVKASFSKTQSHQEESHDDGCSPFCSCSCCAGFAYIIPIKHTSLFTTASAVKNTLLMPIDLSKVSLPVWQPPQLS